MNPDELNHYLLNYIKREKPQGAIMITAPWGSGKSHYINRQLIPFLENQKCEKKCVVISLYSVNSIDDLCKIIIIDSKIKCRLSNKATAATSLVAKTIMHGLSSMVNLDLGFEMNDYKTIFSLSNYSDKVLIFEDVERTKIDIFDLLGFVNNLTEIDNISVVLVVSESDLKRKLEQKKAEYEKNKEKSVYQTVSYTPSNATAIDEIITEFSKSSNQLLLKEGLSAIIQSAIHDAKIYSINYRSLQYGIQQYLDLCDHIKFEADSEFMEELLLSIIIYALRKRNDDSIVWIGEGKSKELGSDTHPLYDFVYDFINNQYFSELAIEKANEAYIQQKEFKLKESKITPYIDTLFHYYIRKGEDVENALEFICKNEESVQIVPKQTCIKLYAVLIALGSTNIDHELINNSKDVIKKRFDDGQYSTLYWDGAFSYDNRSSQEWKEFKEYVTRLNNKDTKIPKNYDIKTIHEVASRLYSSHNDGFIYYFDIPKFVELIKKSNPEMLDQLRGEFITVYESGCPGRGLVIDYPHLEELKQLIERLLPADDPIIHLQLEYFISNIDIIVKGLELQYPDEIRLLSQQNGLDCDEEELEKV